MPLAHATLQYKLYIRSMYGYKTVIPETGINYFLDVATLCATSCVHFSKTGTLPNFGSFIFFSPRIQEYHPA